MAAALASVGEAEDDAASDTVAKASSTWCVEGSAPAEGVASTDRAGPTKIFGADDRFIIGDTTAHPWRTVCKVFTTSPDGSEWIGSGVMVGPSAMLTAGHVVYQHDHGGWASTIEVIPGYDDDYRPWGTAYGDWMWSFNGWINDASFEHDMALVILDRRIGDSTGWLGMASRSDTTLLAATINTGGFPGDVGDGEYMIGATGALDATTANRLYWTGTLDLMSGQSGSGLWVRENENRFVVGVITSDTAFTNAGARLNPEKLAFVGAWRDGYDSPADLRVDSLVAPFSGEVQPGTSGTVSVGVGNFGDAPANAAVEVLLNDLDGTEYVLGTRTANLGSFGRESFDVPVLIPQSAPSGPARIEARVNLGGTAIEWPLDNNTLAAQTFSIAAPWRTASVGRKTWYYLQPSETGRFRFSVPYARRSLKLKLRGSIAATVVRPDGTSFGLYSSQREWFPQVGEWTVTIVNDRSVPGGGWFRVKLSRR